MKGSQKKEMPWFLMKTYRIVDKEETNDIISWSRDNKSFIVWSPITFAEELLPKHFKHNRFSSFIRQLNQYGFRKVDPDRFEFAHEKFVRFQPHILREIVRRKPEHRPRSHRGHGTQQQTDVRNPSVEVGHFGLHEEIERFKRDKNILLNEVVKLRHHQQSNERIMQFTNQRLQRTEQREQQMISFVAKAVENPEVFAQLLLRQNQHNILVEKRGALTGHGNCNSSLEQSGLKGLILKFQSDPNAVVGSLPQCTSCSDLAVPSEGDIKGEEFRNVHPDSSINGFQSILKESRTLDAANVLSSQQEYGNSFQRGFNETLDTACINKIESIHLNNCQTDFNPTASSGIEMILNGIALGEPEVQNETDGFLDPLDYNVSSVDLENLLTDLGLSTLVERSQLDTNGNCVSYDQTEI